MGLFISFDSHKRYTVCVAEDERGTIVDEGRIDHERGAIRKYLRRFPAGNNVAVETIGNWYWIVDEIEEAGMRPLLVHARKAKMMLCCANKTDRLDARGLNLLQRAGTLPVVWIARGELRDKRDLPRTRMRLVHLRSKLKCRLHATLEKYALGVRDASDAYGRKGRAEMERQFELLPPHTRFAARIQLGQIDMLENEIEAFNSRVEETFEETEEVQLLRTIPGIGAVLAVVVWLEVGDVSRFAGADRLAAYAGTTPRARSSGGRTRHGTLRADVNRYLKWAFTEAGNSIALNRFRFPCRHASKLYERVRARRGGQKAVGAVARYLAEAVYWVLTKKEGYREPALKRVLPTPA